MGGETGGSTGWRKKEIAQFWQGREAKASQQQLGHRL